MFGYTRMDALWGAGGQVSMRVLVEVRQVSLMPSIVYQQNLLSAVPLTTLVVLCRAVIPIQGLLSIWACRK